jgi:hypothetical protein
MEEVYIPDPKYKFPHYLFWIGISENSLDNDVFADNNKGIIDSVVLENIKVLGSTNVESFITGLDSEQSVNNVLVKNLQFNKEVVKSLEQANITIGPFVEGIRVEPGNTSTK